MLRIFSDEIGEVSLLLARTTGDMRHVTGGSGELVVFHINIIIYFGLLVSFDQELLKSTIFPRRKLKSSFHRAKVNLS